MKFQFKCSFEDISYFFLKILLLLFDFRERRREGESEEEKHGSALEYMPGLGTELATKACALTWNQLGTFYFQYDA